MRRPLTFAAILLIISVVPLCAQHGGGHAGSGGSHGGFSGGHASFSGSHASSGSHAGFAGHGSGVGGSRIASRFGSGGRGVRFSNGRVGANGFRTRSRYGYPLYGYPYYGYAGIDPYWWWDTYSSNDQDEAQQREDAAEMNAENLDEQRALRQQDQHAYARPMSPPHASQARAPEQAENIPATVLVFRDQHQREIQNYAIVDEMLWIFGPQRIEKVPLAVLNVPATIKANDERGVGFRLPESGSGQ